MQESISTQDVVNQFTTAIELLLAWMEQRGGTSSAKSGPPKPYRRIDENTILNAAEVSDILGISVAFVYRLMEQNIIPSIRIGRSVRIQKGDLDKVIEAVKSHPFVE